MPFDYQSYLSDNPVLFVPDRIDPDGHDQTTEQPTALEKEAVEVRTEAPKKVTDTFAGFGSFSC